jgi:hypothetical protein
MAGGGGEAIGAGERGSEASPAARALRRRSASDRRSAGGAASGLLPTMAKRGKLDQVEVGVASDCATADAGYRSPTQGSASSSAVGCPSALAQAPSRWERSRGRGGGWVGRRSVNRERPPWPASQQLLQAGRGASSGAPRHPPATLRRGNAPPPLPRLPPAPPPATAACRLPPHHDHPRRETDLSDKSCAHRGLRSINILIIGPPRPCRRRASETQGQPPPGPARCGAAPQKAHLFFGL